MNLKFLFPIVVFLLLILFIISYLYKSTSKEAYLEEIELKRQEIIDFMKNDPESPFHVKGEAGYKGLIFFEIDPAFRVKAKIEKIPSPVPFNIQMSDGETSEYFKYAIAHFTLDDVGQKLHLLKSRKFYNEPWLFLPFYDETSAVESYGGGRYLNVEYHGEEEIFIDFNLAYNPYCAYSDNYRCPIPPIENRVTVKVTAGERNYKVYH
jgi:uncharacterized protein (DUF1684 family)